MKKSIYIIPLLLFIVQASGLTIPLNNTCYSTAPNVQTGDVAKNSALGAAYNVTDRDPATTYKFNITNPFYADLGSQYMITDVRINTSVSGGGPAITVYGSADNVTYSPMATFVFPFTGAYRNVSTMPYPNIRYLKVTTTATVLPINMSELEVYGHPEYCYKSDIRFFGTAKDYHIAYMETSYNNSLNNMTLVYDDNANKGVIISRMANYSGAGTWHGFNVLPEVNNNKVYFMLSGNTNAPAIPVILRLDLSTMQVIDFVHQSGATYSMFSLAANNTVLFAYSVGLGSTVQSISAFLIGNGFRITKDVTGTISTVDGVGSLIYNSTTGGAEAFTHSDATITQVTINSSLNISTIRTFVPSAANASVPMVYFNGTVYKVVYTTQDDGNSEIYTANLLGTEATRMTTTSFDEIMSPGVNGIGNGSNGNIFILYQNGSRGNYFINVFCSTSASPSMGTYCVCPAGFNPTTDGSCVQSGFGTANQTFDRVELYVADICQNNYQTNYFYNFTKLFSTDPTNSIFNIYAGIPYCGRTYNGDILNPTEAFRARDYIQVKYLINGQEAYQYSNGSATCKFWATDENIKVQMNHTAGFATPGGAGLLAPNFQQDVNYDLGASNYKDDFCPSFSSAVLDQAMICLRGQIITVECKLNNANLDPYDLDKIQTQFMVIGSSSDNYYTGYQAIKSFLTNYKYNGVVGASVPKNAHDMTIFADATYYQRNSNLDCGFSFGRTPYDYQVMDLMDKVPSGNTDEFSFKAIKNDPSALGIGNKNWSLFVGDNRYTVSCLNLGRNEIATVYDKVVAYDNCNSSVQTAVITDLQMRTSFNNTVLNVSYEGSQFTNKDQPDMTLFIEYTDSAGSHIVKTEEEEYCTWKALNATDRSELSSGIFYPVPQGINTFIGSILSGPESLSGKWPVSAAADGKANYTLQVSCASSLCLGDPTAEFNFTVVNNPCLGTASSCYPLNHDDPASVCKNCFDNTSSTICEDGTPIDINAWACVQQSCIRTTDICYECSRTGHLAVGIDLSLNRHTVTALNPDLKATIRFYNTSKANKLKTSDLTPMCSVFVVSNEGGGRSPLKDCTEFSLASSIPSWNTALCGYEFLMTYDAASDSMIWVAPPTLELNAEKMHAIYAACTGNFASGSECSYRTAFDTFSAMGPGFCPNSVVNITDGGFTKNGFCFEGAPPYICRITSTGLYTTDEACGCPNGLHWNQSIQNCYGNRTPTAADVTGQFTFPNLILLVFAGPFLLGLIYAYLRRSRNTVQKEV